MSSIPAYSIGIDIGGTKISSALVNLQAANPDELLENFQEAPTPQETDAFLETLMAMIDTQKKYQPKVASIGISTAGIVDSVQGKILGSTGNLPAIRGCANLKEILESKAGLPVHVENDANAAAYGECRAGAARGRQDVVMVTLGTGVGTGIVINGNMVRGGHFSAGEGGHIPISNRQERQCTCGRWDCWEAFASGTGVRTTAREALTAASPADCDAFLKISGKTVESVTSHQVVEANQQGNPLAAKILTQWHEHIALGLRAVLNLLDPDAIVIGGGMAKFVDFKQLTDITRPQSMVSDIELVPATLGNQAGIVGAAFLANEAAKSLKAGAFA